MIHFGTWLWGNKYPPAYVDRLRAGVQRNHSWLHRFHVWRPQDADEHLTAVPGCFARLRTFDPDWQLRQGIQPGHRIVVLDLDLVITGQLDQLFNRGDDFAILQGVNASNPCPYNGSVWTLRAGGYRRDVWDEFSPAAASLVPWFQFPDDQAWLAAKIPNAGKLGPADGVYAFKKPGWPPGLELPPAARIVAFPGHRDPQQFAWLPWIQEHWRK